MISTGACGRGEGAVMSRGIAAFALRGSELQLEPPAQAHGTGTPTRHEARAADAKHADARPGHCARQLRAGLRESTPTGYPLIYSINVAETPHSLPCTPAWALTGLRTQAVGPWTAIGLSRDFSPESPCLSAIGTQTHSGTHSAMTCGLRARSAVQLLRKLSYVANPVETGFKPQ